ncbi:hypothetical protein KSW81_003925 [Nannochloris sp. 'desiccata']|nr:hypothetical protein KSW81_003925 [Chlorella desiccata (nom. nud.)]
MQSTSSFTASSGIFRRDLLLTVAASALATLAFPRESCAAENAAVTSSLGRYVKRKKLDRIDSYVAPLLTAREQLIRIGRVMGASPKDARQLLRSGSFSGLRASVRAIGDYQAERGAGKEAGTAVVTAFFSALEKLDYELLSAERATEDTKPDKAVARQKLDATIAALDKLLESVPQDALNRANDMVNSLGSESEGSGDGNGDGGALVVDEAELKRLGQLF